MLCHHLGSRRIVQHIHTPSLIDTILCQLIIFVADEGMISVHIDSILDRTKLSEVHHHTLRWRCRIHRDISLDRYLDTIAMTMQMATLARMIGQSMCGFEAKLFTNNHDRKVIKRWHILYHPERNKVE